ncbi:MAG: GNAT family N-acetyltransferase, partial [Chloroflexi bacterium]|nr:GNAT family N-acetyltransferase [Chloroflexota bacterium]
HAAGNFHTDELTTPLELFDGYLRDPKVSGYNFLSAKRDDQVVGYACYGPTALTEGTFDLYWIVAEASTHGQGVGRALFERVASEVKKGDGRLLMIWTSSTPDYERARKFYERMGCKLEAQIKNFYRAGDDLCIFSFRIADFDS